MASLKIETRLREIEQKYIYLVQDFLVLRSTEETFKMVLILNDGTTLRVTERWENDILTRYSYYWLDEGDRLKIGWDNSPHHTQLSNFPYHKHVGEQSQIEPSYEVCLEDVMKFLENKL